MADPDLEPGRALAVEGFFDEAEAMRQAFEARVGPARELAAARFVWDYWHVPGQYTYLRTLPRNVLGNALYARFLAAVKAWSGKTLGCGRVSEPWLSYYISGCRQELHTDVVQGAFAYVFSLTRWEQRRFEGGETLLLRPPALDYWEHHDPAHPVETDALMLRVPSHFNQLLVFDARVPHGVTRVEGTHDPLDSRVVLHGWVSPADLTVEGALRAAQVAEPVRAARARWAAKLPAAARLTGLLVVRAEADASGAVTTATVLSRTLLSRAGDRDAQARAETLARELLLALRLPPADGASTLTVALNPADR